MQEIKNLNYFGSWIDSCMMLGLGDGNAQQPALPTWQDYVFNPITMITVLIVLYYVMVLIPQRRERDSLAQKLASLKKNDRVVTVGGIHGTVVNTSDSDSVVVRVDDNNNTRIQFNRSAISRVIRDDDEK